MADITGDFYASEGSIGYGAELGVGQGDSPETFVSIPIVMTITPGAMTTGVVDATHLRSPNRHREKKLTIRDSAEITMKAQYLPSHGAHLQAGGDGFDADHSLISLWIACAENNFQITYPDAFSDLVIALRGGITTYHPGEISTEALIMVDLGITPLRDYFTGPA